MQLSALIRDYEKILLALVEAHNGELIKRMGDGHLFVFHQPIAAVLAAIRLQKSLRRFNRYRDETSRVVIRIGIHCGSVVRKEQGDVLGNTVNIASRLESSSQPGSILVSEQVHEKVKDFVHAREIGRITVKNISEPIRVYEPYEIALDLPEALDPMKGGKAAAVAARAAGRAVRGILRGLSRGSGNHPADHRVLHEPGGAVQERPGRKRPHRLHRQAGALLVGAAQAPAARLRGSRRPLMSSLSARRCPSSARTPCGTSSTLFPCRSSGRTGNRGSWGATSSSRARSGCPGPRRWPG